MSYAKECIGFLTSSLYCASYLFRGLYRENRCYRIVERAAKCTHTVAGRRTNRDGRVDRVLHRVRIRQTADDKLFPADDRCSDHRKRGPHRSHAAGENKSSTQRVCRVDDAEICIEIVVLDESWRFRESQEENTSIGRSGAIGILK